MITEESLKNLELELLTYSCRHDQVRVGMLIADDFFECGKHGDRFGKKEVLDSLPNESQEKQFETHDMTIHILTPGIAQVRYICVIQYP